MIATLETLKKELEEYKDTLVIGCGEVVKLIDVEEGEFDYYWVYMHRNGHISGESCVGKWTPLKGFLPDDEYKKLEHPFNYLLKLLHDAGYKLVNREWVKDEEG